LTEEEEDDIEELIRGVYDVRKDEPNASRLRDCVDFVFSNNDKAAGVSDPTPFFAVVTPMMFLFFLFLTLEVDDDVASFARRINIVSAFCAARSLLLVDEI
jgi:hypothetical protein